MIPTLTLLTASAGIAWVRGVKGLEPEAVHRVGALGRARYDWTRTVPVDGGVPSSVFARAMTSLPVYYRDNLDLLGAHLEEEHDLNFAESPDVSRSHLCCGDYRHGPAIKSSLADAMRTVPAGSDVADGVRSAAPRVRTALNHAEGYCAIAHLSPSMAASAATLIHETARCSPLTHACKEPLSLLSPTPILSADEVDDGMQSSFFGLKLGESLQDGPKRGLVVSMSPGTFSAGVKKSSADPAASVAEGSSGPSNVASLEKRWKGVWASARGSDGAREFADRHHPWTSSKRSVGGGGREGRRLAGAEGLENDTRDLANWFHGEKVRGHRAAFEHLSKKMEAVDGGDVESAGLFGPCGLDNVKFVHAYDDVLYLRGIHDTSHDEETAAACFMGLVGFLSAQPDVMHMHPEAKAVLNNRYLTAYMEGGSSTSATPMRMEGLDGSGEVIGVTDTGLDDSSCFFRDNDEEDVVPRTTMEDAEFYPDRRKVIQYIAFVDDVDDSGHGTHVSGTAAGAVYADWETDWTEKISEAQCEDADSTMSCFGDCVKYFKSTDCHWNPEYACPLYSCDNSTSCDDYTGFDFPCFDDPEEELPEGSGMATGAKLSFLDVGGPDGSLTIADDLKDMWDAQRKSGARIMTNSWSLTTSYYSNSDVTLDEWVYDNPDCIVLFGVGNNNDVESKTIRSPATAKTAMSVGASNNGEGHGYAYYNTNSSDFEGVKNPDGDSDFDVSSYSARGPVGDFTAKPDVVAPGFMVHSAKASGSQSHEETCALSSLGGTSMSAPAVAGAAAIVRQYFTEGYYATLLEAAELCGSDMGYDDAGLCDAFEPSGYLVKAVLINSAQWLGQKQSVSYDGDVELMTVLDFAQGFGAVQLLSALPTSSSNDGSFFHEHELASEKKFYYTVYVDDPNVDLSVTVAWYDPPSTVASYNLLHDLDTYVYSMSEDVYYRANSYNTINALCQSDNTCAAKYDFSYSNNLADDMNPVERTVVSADVLVEGYYVICVRSRSITESDTQTYGLAAAGGGIVLEGISSSWSGATAVVNSAFSSLGEPDPFADPTSPSPSTSSVASVTSQNPSSSLETGSSNDSSGTSPAPTASSSTSPAPTDGSGDVERAVTDDDESGQSTSSEVDDSTGGGSQDDGASSSNPSNVNGTDTSGGSSGVDAGDDVVGDVDDDSTGASSEGGDDDGDDAVSVDTASQSSVVDTKETIILGLSVVTGAAVMLACGLCCAIRLRRQGGGEEKTGAAGGSSRGLSKVPLVGGLFGKGQKVPASTTHESLGSVMGEEGAVHDFDMESVHMHSAVGSEWGDAGNQAIGGHRQAEEVPPSYAAAVAVGGDEFASGASLRSPTETVPGIANGGTPAPSDGTTIVPTDSDIDDHETSLFYAAVDPTAVSKLVGWGISRDFARVALRQADNDIPEALKIVAQGDMDARLARDHEAIAAGAGANGAAGK